MDEQRRLILAFVLSGLVLMTYFFFFVEPTRQAAEADARAEIERIAAEQQPIAEQTITPPQPRDVLVATGARVQIDAPGIRGSLLTTGSRLDDITLNDYDKTLDPEDGQVELLSPAGGERAAFVADNWTLPGMTDDTLGLNTAWVVESGTRLTPDTPVVLRAEVGGVDIQRTLTVDEHFLVTASDVLTNRGAQPVTLTRQGLARQINRPLGLLNFFIIQEGPVSVQDDSYHDFTYNKTEKEDWANTGEAGWAGITDRY